MNLVLLGPPGSGKGTQATLLGQRLGLVHLASGDLLRRAVEEGTELGRRAKSYMERGVLVPDEVVIGLILAALRGEGRDRGFILDGFPRNLEQAKALDKALRAGGSGVDRAVSLRVAELEVVHRLSGRWTCRRCQAPYNIWSSPPREPGRCDRCGGELYQRPDDQPQTIRKRLEVYLSETAPLADYYRAQGKLVEVDGGGEAGEVMERIVRALGSYVG